MFLAGKNNILRTLSNFIAFASVLILFNGVSVAQEDLVMAGEPATVRVLSLHDCLEIAQVENISLKRTRLGFESSLLDRMKAESIFDPGFQAGFSGRHTSSGTGGDSNRIDLGMKFTFPTWDGGRWIFSFDQARADGTTTIGGASSNFTAYSTSLGLTYALPLLEGSGERINRIAVNRADLSVARSEAMISETMRSLRFGIIQTYINAVLAARAINVARLSLENAGNLVEEVQARINVGQLAPYEMLAARAGLAEREENLINAKASYKIALDSLKELIGLPLVDEIAIDTNSLSLVNIVVNVDDLFLQAQKSRPDLQELDIRISQARLDLLLAEDRRKASLLWNTSLGLSGEGDGYGDSISDLENFSWYTGLEYQIPLGGNRAAVADAQNAALNLENLELERTNYLRGLMRDIRAAVEELDNALLRIDVTLQGLEVQKVKIESERTRLSLGLITSRDMLEFDVQYASALLAYDRAIADAMLAVAKIEYLTDRNLLEDALVLGNIQNDRDD
ncbi:MAG TPA: TolC family protein [Firmicutes bacterium]|nr:TolC family protein [Bacillota bacterium]